MAKPDATRQSVLTFVSPDLDDLLFWEHVTLSRVGPTNVKDHPVYGYGKPHHNAGLYPNHKVVHLKHDPLYQGADEDSQRYRVFYAAEREDQDAYNFTWTAADLGGNKYDAVQRVYVTLRSEFDEDDVQVGDIMPDAGDAVFGGDMILTDRQVSRIGEAELDSLFVLEKRTYIRRVNLISDRVDATTGKALQTTETLYYRGETYPETGGVIEAAVSDSGNWGLNASGVSVEAKQLSDNWFAVTNSDVIPQSLPDGTYGKQLWQYTTWENFSWPAVIRSSSFSFSVIASQDGSSSVTVDIEPYRKQYSGPTKTRRTQYWNATPQNLEEPTLFIGTDLDYSGVQYSVSLRNVLTPGLTLIDTIGNNDPTYQQGSYGKTIAPTALTDWPGSTVVPTVVAIKQEPYRGGFLVTVKEVYRPS